MNFRGRKDNGETEKGFLVQVNLGYDMYCIYSDQIMYKKYYLRSIHVNTYIKNQDCPHQCSICVQPHKLLKY